VSLKLSNDSFKNNILSLISFETHFHKASLVYGLEPGLIEICLIEDLSCTLIQTFFSFAHISMRILNVGFSR